MRRAAIALAAAGGLAFGSSAAQAADLRIGYVDAEKVLEESPQLESARNALQSEFSRRDQDLVAKQKQLKQLEEKLTRDSAIMSDAERKRLEKDIITRRRTLKNEVSAFQEDLNLRRSEEFNKLRRKVLEVVREVGKEDQMDIILSDGVVYSSKQVDISDKILERLRREASGQ
ncbi:MAG: OmpH family outer membrane protein [Chromatiales bacterium]